MSLSLMAKKILMKSYILLQVTLDDILNAHLPGLE